MTTTDTKPNGNPLQEVPAARRKGRRTRTNYAAKYAELQARHDMATRVLRECDEPHDQGVTAKLVRVALKTLAGEE
jgi:hypothetical protein